MKTATKALWTMVFLTTCGASSVFVTSDPNGGWTEGGYYVHNNMWNSAKYSPCTSTLKAWSHDQWLVVTKMNNEKGDGAVKTYPNVHRDYHAVPVGSFDAITSNFAETSPRAGIYDFAYDLWINGIGEPGCTEIMIWTENFKQVPGGSYVQDVAFDGRTYKVYKSFSSDYIAFVATTNFASGMVNLLEVIKWVMAKGWLADKSTLNQICFGVEMVSTDNAEQTFQVTAFSIDEKTRPTLDLRVPASNTTNITPAGSREKGP